MKIIASGDHHFDEGRRFDECRRVHAWIAEQVRRERPDALLSGGDVYERASTPRERAAVAEWLEEVADVCPVIIAKGNHDRPLDCQLLSRLRTRHPVVVEERCGVHRVGDGAVAVVAWPNTASLAAMVGRPLPSDALDHVAREALRGVLAGLGAELAAHDGPRVLLMHAMVDGSVTSVGQPLIGAELNVSLEDLALARAQLAIAAHIHCPQDFTLGGVSTVYPGSPFRTTFGEVEEKSIVLAEITRAGASWSRLATPATPMLLVEAEWSGGRFASSAWSPETGWLDPKGAEIRFRYQVDADQRDEARRVAAELRDDLLLRGALVVKIEEQVRATTRARTPEVAEARTLADQLRAFWRAKNITMSTEREERVLGRLATLETEIG